MSIITRIRKSYLTKGLALTIGVNMLVEVIWPTAAMALTSGPSQPEVQSFEPIETTDMVDLFTGDFTYNIPLINLPGPNGGYPINLSYHGGVTMDQEASWVGLGWNINAGSLVRNVRGFADDANGDTLISKVDMKNNYTIGLGATVNIEILGGDLDAAKIADLQDGESDPSLSLSLGARYNSYKGFGANIGASFSPPTAGDHDFGSSFGINLDSETGLGVNASFSLEAMQGRNWREGMGLSYSNEGLGLSFSLSKSVSVPGERDTDQKMVKKYKGSELVGAKNYKGKTASIGGTSSIGFSTNMHAPSFAYPMRTNHINLSLKTGPGSLWGIYGDMNFSGYFNIQYLKTSIRGKDEYKQVYGFENMEYAKAWDVLDFSREKESQVSKTMSNLATPMLTYDTYNVSGQGISGYFRPFRTDVGRLHDPRITSKIFGGSLAFDLSPLTHIGFGGTVTYGEENQQEWEQGNEWKVFKFKARSTANNGETYLYKDKERLYYKMHGDKSSASLTELDFIGGENALHPENDNTILNRKRLKQITVPNGIESTRPSNERVSRNILIHKFTNEELESLFDGDSYKTFRERSSLQGETDVAETSIFFYDWEQNDENAWDPYEASSFKSEPDYFFLRETRGPNNNQIGHHNAGYKVLNDQGQYYVYALPAYNNTETVSMFSIDGDGSLDATKDISVNGSEVDYEVPGTNEFLDKKTKAPYAHSYMLTSILGADYVDLEGDGATDDDLGYWVRFDYTRYTEDYKWRAPYYGANYDRGSLATTDDDKGSYVYGEKELWYLSKIETKTHVLVFTLSERQDNLEAYGEFANSSNGPGTKSGLKIDKISLYEKDEYRLGNPVAIQEVHFEYDYSLCGNVPNNTGNSVDENNDGVNDNAEEGKLTLRKIWFTYAGSTKGALTPYTFDYNNEPGSSEGVIEYDEFAYDRWGSYKQDGSSANDNLFKNRYLPYVEQFDPVNADSTEAHQELKDEIAGAWSLKTIHLPSGGQIDMTYEADDYAYVQNEVATQMFEITAVNDNTTGDDLLYNMNQPLESDDFSNYDERRIYFKLEIPLDVGQTDSAYAAQIYEQYVRGLVEDESHKKNLYFKNYMDFRDGIWGYVSGYIPIEESPNNKGTDQTWLYGVDTGSSQNGSYRKGFITIEQHPKKMTSHDNWNDTWTWTYHDKYHPMAIAAWNHMKLSEPLMLTAPAGIDLSSAADGSNANKADAAASLLGFIPNTVQLFTGLYKYCENNNFARRIDLSKSVIRLCTPDKKKYGGGHRIKQIQLSDNWNAFSGEATSTYGVRYEYSTTDTLNDGSIREYSSGVAQYEPKHGGDEIALRYPKAYPNKLAHRTKLMTYFEHPVNEFYYPSPTVGYSKVTVKSINTDNQIKQAEQSSNNSGIGTTGLTVYEFYTAKDYPVIVEETEIDKAKLNLQIPIPFIGRWVRKKIWAIQGYKIELNDMHGKVKSVKKFGLNKDYSINLNETSSIEYVYQHTVEPKGQGQGYYYRLDNTVKTLDDDIGIPSTSERMLGVEYDFFTDQRQNKGYTVVAGLHTNVDLPPLPFPFPSIWPQFSSIKKDMKTMTTNKVIFKSGILKETKAFDGKSSVVTTNEVFDEQTGRPIIVSVNNEFKDKIYNYSHPAHWEYDRMGAAYRNIDLEFESKLTAAGTLDGHYVLETDSDVIDRLVQGDVLIVKNGSTGFWVTYLGELSSTTGAVHVEDIGESEADAAINTEVDCRVIRSGRRNHVYADAGKLVTLQLPVIDGNYTPDYSTHTQNISETIGTDNVSFTGFKIYAIDDVVNATAMQFRDEWMTQSDSANPFETGESGIWRPVKSYTYVGNRNTGTDADNPDIRYAGVMDSVDLFDWQVMDFEQYSPNWAWTSEISRYNSEAYELENINRLGIKSAALYSSKGSLVQAVGANAGYHEIGVEDFEDFGVSSTVTFGEMAKETNLNFYNSTTLNTEDSCIVIKNFRINKGISLTSGQFIVELATNYDFSGEVELVVQTSEFTDNSSTDKAYSTSYRIPCTVVSSTQNGDNVELKVQSAVEFSSTYYTFMNQNRIVRGRVSVKTATDRNYIESLPGTVSFVNSKAHSGKNCMELDGNGNYIFSQGSMDLDSTKVYVLSAWVSQASEKKIDYDNIDILPVVWTGSVWTSAAINGTDTKSKVVEGWQKIEMEFAPSSDYLFGIKVIAQNEKVYVDDIRISPKTGGMVTYVYDQENYRLNARLDNNNFATFYYYDEEGNLHLTKRETERGIQTISENRGHNRETAGN